MSGEFSLDDVPRVGVYDRLVTGGDLVLGYLAFVGFDAFG